MPGLLTLTTDLKSLKYGHDRPGGGSSGQPYVKTDINTLKNGIITIPNFLGFDDGLIRGGMIGAANASIVDTFRIGKFFLDLPKGPLFIAKQIGLQLSNPRLETVKLSADQESRSIFRQPTRLYNLGINTIAQVPANAFGIHFDRHGLLPIQDEQTKYENVVKKNNKDFNRLLGLKKELGLIENLGFKRIQQRNTLIPLRELGLENPELFKNGLDPTQPETDPNLVPFSSDWISQYLPPDLRKNSSTRIVIGGKIPSLSYFGGPESVYGIGNTNIKRFVDTVDIKAIDDAFTKSSQRAGKSRDDKGAPIDINYANTLGVSRFYFQTVDNIKENTGININTPNQKPNNLDLPTYSNIPGVKSYQTLIESTNKTQNSSPLNNIFYQGEILDKTTTTYNSAVYKVELLKEDITYKNSYGQAVVLKNWKRWSDVTREQRIGHFGSSPSYYGVTDKFKRDVNRADSINLTPVLYKVNNSEGINKLKIKGVEHNIEDLVKFRIAAIDGDDPENFADYMIFRAYLTQFSDSTDATWNPIKYAGRGEQFYTYDGFSRKIQIGFKVAALSVEEMEPMYKKLNYLMSNLMPDYKDELLMRGPLVKMTVGNWINSQPGILNSLSYTIPNDSPWEININNTPTNTEDDNGNKILVLPHIVEVSISFTPIGAEQGYLPSKNTGYKNIYQSNAESFAGDINWDLKSEVNITQ